MKKVEIDEILYPPNGFDDAESEKKVRAGFWQTVRKAAKRIPFMEDVVAGYYCALDPETPARVRGVLLAALAYFVLPLDFVPDFLVGFGFTDDVAVLMAAFSAIRGNITDAHRSAARKALAEQLDTANDL